jgi:hypothetical protein
MAKGDGLLTAIPATFCALLYAIVSCGQQVPVKAPTVTEIDNLEAVPAQTGPVSVTTWRYNTLRNGLNKQETVLTTSNVNVNQFGKLCSAVVDGQIYAQPLIANNVTIGGTLYSSVAYVETQNDSIYAFDANSAGPVCTQLLFANLLPAGEEAVDCKYFGGGNCKIVAPNVGILGTPVINTAIQTIYLITQSQLGEPPTAYYHRIHALNITNFQEQYGGPVVIAGNYKGKNFTSSNHIQRPGLLLLQGSSQMVYVGFSLMDGSKFRPTGWVFGFRAQSLTAPPLVFATAPIAFDSGGGIWQGGAGLAAGADSSGTTYIYVATADGVFDASTGGSDYGDSFLKLPTDLSGVTDYFTPFTQECMDSGDNDFGSGGVMLLPTSTVPAFPRLGITGSKEGTLYLVDLDDLGGYNGNSDCTGTNANVQTLTGFQSIHTSPAYWNHNIYFAPYGEIPLPKLLMYQIGGNCSPGPLCTSPFAISKAAFPWGVSPSVSVNGTVPGSAIVWAISGPGVASGGGPAVLFAFDATNLNQLYSSSGCGTQDVPGAAVKFSVPAVANGRVYIGTQTDFDIYGELSTSRTC